MNSKTNFLLLLFFIFFVFSVKAQEETKLGTFLAYGTEIESIGIGANAEFPIMENLTISPSIIYFLPKDEFGIKLNWFEVNANANYYLLQQSSLALYALGGLNYSSVKVSFDEPGFGNYSASDGRLGLNLGAGANFKISGNITPFAEIRYVIIEGGQLVLGAGVRFNI